MKVKNNGQGLRMYFFVMGNISGRQQGIQAGHAAVEYGLQYGNTKQYKDFAKYNKTFIVLDGGGSGDMLNREQELENYSVKFASFLEPDLNDSISAIAFIVPESIYNFEAPVDAHTEKAEFSGYLKSFRLASN
jgi:hypothetical protein